MVKELLSDFSIIAKPTYQPDTFKPYFSVILTIISFTVLLFSLQKITFTLHAYADNPTTFHNIVLQERSCHNFSQKVLLYLCSEESITKPNYASSLEQDLHNSTN